MKDKLLLILFLFPVAVIVSALLSVVVYQSITSGAVDISALRFGNIISLLTSERQIQAFFLAILGVAALGILVLVFNRGNDAYTGKLVKITDKISTPAPAGQKQHGSAKWMSQKDFDKQFDHIELSAKSQAPDSGGTVIDMAKKHGREKLYYVGDDIHTLCIGSTRSGKTRCVVLESIGLLGLAGESMILSDPKAELFTYTAPFLESQSYEVIAFDFRQPLKSHRYNFLQNVIDAVHNKDIPRAIDCAWDITSSLVGENKGERIWNDGEASVIASSILAVVYDNIDRPEFQNLTNVYYFIANMCQTAGTDLPINQYMKSRPDSHPAKALLGISEVAPSRTRGSFFTSALTTLRLFTNPLIYAMTCKSDFRPQDIGREKQAVFILLPDEKATYYSLASLFVSQAYELLVGEADKLGGRLERRVNLVLDEFGNFTKIPAFANKLTVGGGRGIRFSLFVQSLAQIEEAYGKESSTTIKGNCAVWIYLCADDPATLDEISKRLGNYTVATCSKSSSYGTHSSGSSSSSINLTGRPLLTPDEVRMIDRPYSLITSRNHPAVLHAPDLGEYAFNRMFGLGDKTHNQKIRLERESARPKRNTADAEMKLWKIWDKYRRAERIPSFYPAKLD